MFWQNKSFSKESFAGTWEYKQRFHNLRFEIKFENNSDYATIIDIGTGEAPELIFQAEIKGNLLVIQAQQRQNDYMEFEIIKRKLHFRTRPTIWDENGEAVPIKSDFFATRIFKRLKK